MVLMWVLVGLYFVTLLSFVLCHTARSAAWKSLTTLTIAEKQ